MKNLFLVPVLLLFLNNSFAQIGFGTVGGLDFYQRYSNPDDNIAYRSSGNAILNLVWGPRVWIGIKEVSLSVEGQVNLGLTSLALKDYKGIGALAFPVIAKVNFKGLSGIYAGFSPGISLGVGMQWSKTELFYLSKTFKDKGVVRNFNKTYIVQIDFGVGSFGSAGSFYVRYGRNFETKASVLNTGIIISINSSYSKKHKEYQKPPKPK